MKTIHFLKWVGITALALLFVWVEVVAFFATIFKRDYDIPDFKNTML